MGTDWQLCKIISSIFRISKCHREKDKAEAANGAWWS